MFYLHIKCRVAQYYDALYNKSNHVVFTFLLFCMAMYSACNKVAVIRVNVASYLYAVLSYLSPVIYG